MDSLSIYRILSKCPITKKHFRGVHPIDHASQCITRNNRQLQIFIFNSEESTSPGLHWILVSTKGKQAEIFDTLNFPPKLVYREIFNRLKKLQYYPIIKTPYRIQAFTSGVCGHHVIYYAILKCLKVGRKKIFSQYYRKNEQKQNDRSVKKIIEHLFF